MCSRVRESQVGMDDVRTSYEKKLQRDIFRCVLTVQNSVRLDVLSVQISAVQCMGAVSLFVSIHQSSCHSKVFVYTVIYVLYCICRGDLLYL